MPIHFDEDLFGKEFDHILLLEKDRISSDDLMLTALSNLQYAIKDTTMFYAQYLKGKSNDSSLWRSLEESQFIDDNNEREKIELFLSKVKLQDVVCTIINSDATGLKLSDKNTNQEIYVSARAPSTGEFRGQNVINLFEKLKCTTENNNKTLDTLLLDSIDEYTKERLLKRIISIYIIPTAFDYYYEIMDSLIKKSYSTITGTSDINFSEHETEYNKAYQIAQEKIKILIREKIKNNPKYIYLEMLLNLAMNDLCKISPDDVYNNYLKFNNQSYIETFSYGNKHLSAKTNSILDNFYYITTTGLILGAVVLTVSLLTAGLALAGIIAGSILLALSLSLLVVTAITHVVSSCLTKPISPEDLEKLAKSKLGIKEEKQKLLSDRSSSGSSSSGRSIFGSPTKELKPEFEVTRPGPTA